MQQGQSGLAESNIGGEAVLLGNTFVRSDGMPPIVALLQGARATLIENSIQGGGVGGIMLDGRMEAFRNTIEGKGGGSGVVVQEKGEATLMGNRISGYRKEVSDPGKVTIIGEGNDSIISPSTISWLLIRKIFSLSG